MDHQLKSGTIWTNSFIAIFIANFAMNMGQYMMNTLIPKFANSLGADATIVGLVTGMFAVTALAIRPVSGPAFDYFSKKKLYTAAVSVTLTAFIGYGLSTSVPMIIVFRLIHGLGMGMTAPLGLSIAGESLPEDKMGSGIGVYSMGQAVAQAIGPSMGLALAKKIGYNPTFLIGAAIMAAAVLLSTRLEVNYRKPDDKFRLNLSKMFARKAIVPAVMYAFLSIAYSCVHSFITLDGEANGVDNIGLYFTVYACSIIVIRPFSGKLMDRKGLSAAVIPACILFAVSFFVLSLSHTIYMFLLAAVLAAFGYGSLQPAVQAMCMGCVSKEERGAAANTNYTGADIGQLVGPVIGGAVAQQLLNSVHAEDITDSVLAAQANASAYAMMYRVMIIPIVTAFILFLVFRTPLTNSYRSSKKAENDD